MSDGIVLASASPRRRDLLRQIGLDFTVVPARVEERVWPGETPEAHVQRLSLSKAAAIAGQPQIAGRWFIGSDTIVLCDDIIMGKPDNPDHAAAMLRQLSGRDHQVLTGFAVIDRHSDRKHVEAVTTRVSFRRLTEGEIAGYIANGEPMDKAGAYAIQGLGVYFVAAIEGSYSNVVGLPLCRLTLALKDLGAPLPL